MRKVLLNIFLYLSSFIPLYFLIICKELIEIANNNLSFNITNSLMLSINFVFIVLGIVGCVISLKSKNHQNIKVIEFKNTTCQNFLPYFPLFVLFALAFELEFISMACVYLLIIAMIGVVYIKNNMFYVNPFLNILGFSTYQITYVDDNGEKLTKNVLSKTALKNTNYKLQCVFVH